MSLSESRSRHAPTASRVPPRLAAVLREAGKFGGVGMLAYAVDAVLFNLCVYAWHFDTYTAKLLATLAGVCVAFTGNRLWTWRDRKHANLGRQYLWYFGFNTIGLGITMVFVYAYELGVERWPQFLDNPAALNLTVNVLGVGTASLFRFYAYRTWVFPPR